MRKRRRTIIGIPFIVGLFGAVLMASLLLADFVVSGSAPIAPNQSILYVDDDTCPASGSGTQGNPYCSIQDAVDAATPGDEIRVAQGHYTGSQTIPYAPWGGTAFTYTQIVFINKQLTLRGGYGPGAWDASEPAARPTVIDAEGHGRGISIVAAGSVPVTIEGFTVTGGDYTSLGNPTDGGATVCRSEGGEDCGGGVYAYASMLVLRNSVITGNVAGRDASNQGGGIYLWDVREGTLIENTTVAGNSALAAYGTGGGLYAFQINGAMTISNTVFADNHAESSGGGLMIYNADALVTIEAVDFLRNTASAHEGGGAHVRLTDDGDLLHMDRCRFVDNQAQERGAAVYLHAAYIFVPRARLSNLLFTGNATTSTLPSGAVLAIDGAFTDMEVDGSHITAADNQAPTFLFAKPSRYDTHGLTVTLKNTLVTSFTRAFAAEEVGSGQALIRHDHTLTSAVTTLHHTVGGAPTFVSTNPVSGDPMLDTTYHLQPGSAAIDAGSDAGVSTDIDGHFRPQSVAPDIGADEYVFAQPPAAVSIVGPTTVAAQSTASFVASIRPVTAALPITYVWQTTGQPRITHAYRGLTDTVALSWPTVGAKTITITATSAEGTASDIHAVQVTGEPVLAIGKSGPAEALPGEPFTYTLTVTNSGVVEATGLVITDALPAGTTYLSGGTLSGGEVSWSQPTVAANGGVAHVSFVVTATQSVNNSSYAVTADGGYRAAGTEPVVTVVGVPDLSISKTGPYAVASAQSILYELTVTNQGPVAAHDLIITDTLPVGATYLSGGNLTGDEVRWELATLPSNGGQATVSFAVTATQSIVNEHYQVSARGAFTAAGTAPVTTIVGTGTRYVAPGGSDGLNNCTDTGAPCATLQHAVEVANAGEEVRVAAGTYTGAATLRHDLWGGDTYTYTQVVLIDKALTLLGGYPAGSWTTRDPAANSTIINAAGRGRGITVIAVGSGPVTVDGFTITGGDYSGLGNPPGAVNTVCSGGGGEDCGGGIYAYATALVLRNTVITDNVAGRDSFSDGGGVYLWEVPAGTRIEDCIIARNRALGEYASGGGLYAHSIRSPMTITRSTVEDNYAEGVGGGIHLYDVDAPLLIEETAFDDNTAAGGEGGGARIRLTGDGQILQMDRVWMRNNRADQKAAGLLLDAAGVDSPRALLTNIVFAGNATDGNGDADAVIGIDGGFTSMEVSFAHVTAADNRTPTFLHAAPAGDAGDLLTVSLTNTLLVSFTHAFAAEEGTYGDATIYHRNTLTHNVANLHQAIAGSPVFHAQNPLTGDPKLNRTYHLEADSTAINAGVLTGVLHDIDGQPRPPAGPVDVGADEYVAVAPTSVAILGPTTGLVRRTYTFVAAVSPVTATGPFTYTWSPTPNAGQGSDQATYAWASQGAKTLTVTAASTLGTTPPASHVITLELNKVYLPVVMKE